MGKISVVINTLNEEKNLGRALSSVHSWAYEVVVVDMHSDDSTVEIAKKYGARVYSHARTGYVEPARNFAIGKTRGDWVLILDADEEISSTLRKKLQMITNDSEADYYALPRKNIIFGKWISHSKWWPDYNIRFFKKGAVEWAKEIHSVPLTTGRGKDVVAKEEYAIVHYHYESVEQYINRLNRYTTIQAKEKKKQGKTFVWQSLIKKPAMEFNDRYFAAKGYKDGVHGLALALLQAFSELVVEIKLWELIKYPVRDLQLNEVSEELKASQKEVNYWIADTLISEEGGVVNYIKRKFRLP